MSEDAIQPLQAHILWGSTLDPEDTPSSYEFKTQEELDAFWRGTSEADGYMEMEQVTSPDMFVNKDGEIVDRKVKKPTVIKPHSRFVVWGEHPESGSRPTAYEFENDAIADAFILGASEMVGWMGYQQVPAPDYRLLGDRGGDHLSPLGRLAAAAIRHSELVSEDGLFLATEGSYVQEGWSMGDAVVDFVPCLDACLQNRYAIGLIDAGVDPELLARMMDDYEGSPEAAAEWYGEKYDLTRREENLPRRPKV